MSANILDDARAFLVNSLRGKKNSFETKHPWRKDWESAVLLNVLDIAYPFQ
jgi:hypothetical protein